MKNYRTLRANLGEMMVLALVALIVISSGWRIFESDLLLRQLVVWVANVLMLLTIWAGLYLRKQPWELFGLRFSLRQDRPVLRVFWQSLLVFLAAMAGFVLGSVIAGMLIGNIPSGGPGGYEYLQGNLPVFLLALCGVLIVSSFGEEVIYRGFLMTRIAEMGGGSRKSWIFSAIISAIIFGLIHFGWGVFGIIQTTFMGLALAVSYLLIGRNLWVLILAHAYMDIILLVQMYLAPAHA